MDWHEWIIEICMINRQTYNKRSHGVLLCHEAQNWDFQKQSHLWSSCSLPASGRRAKRPWSLKDELLKETLCFCESSILRGGSASLLNTSNSFWYAALSKCLHLFPRRRNIHGVPREKIHRMKERYEHDVTFHSVLHAEKPSRMNRNQDRNDRSNASPSNGARYWHPYVEFPNRRAPGGFTNEGSFNRRGGCHHGY